MLKGKQFGEAIGLAIGMKLERNLAASKAEIARHFNMKPPSLSDWVKKGSVAKDKLPELWRYFSDVAGPSHWGMTEKEWPAGLTAEQTVSAEVIAINENQTRRSYVGDADDLIRDFQSLSDAGQATARTMIKSLVDLEAAQRAANEVNNGRSDDH